MVNTLHRDIQAEIACFLRNLQKEDSNDCTRNGSCTCNDIYIPDSGNGDRIYNDADDSYDNRVENANYTECVQEMHRFYETLTSGKY